MLFSVQNILEEWFHFNLIVPDIQCDHCVLQWRYHTANTWGSDENGTGTGHGPQEEFYGCADVEIIGTGATPRPTTKVNRKSLCRVSDSTSTFHRIF